MNDGGFESPTVPATTFTRYGVGTSLGAWTVTTNDVDLSGAGFWETAEGDQSLDLITGRSKTNMGYVGRQAVFVATGFSTVITFAGTTGSGWGPVIDKVSVDNCLPLLCL